MKGIERSIQTLYLEGTGSGSVRNRERFGKGFRFVVRKRGNSISAIGQRITRDRISKSSDYLSNENLPGTGALSGSVGISSEIRHISRGISRTEIDTRPINGFLNRRTVPIGQYSDLVSGHIDESIPVVYAA